MYNAEGWIEIFRIFANPKYKGVMQQKYGNAMFDARGLRSGANQANQANRANKGHFSHLHFLRLRSMDIMVQPKAIYNLVHTRTGVYPSPNFAKRSNLGYNVAEVLLSNDRLHMQPQS